MLLAFLGISVLCIWPVSFSFQELKVLLTSGVQAGKLSDFLLRNPIVTIFIGISLSFLTIFLPKPLRWVFLVLYVFFILYMTILFRAPGERIGNFEMFSSYSKALTSQYYQIEVIQNVWLFIPFGACLYSISGKRWMLVFPLILSLIIEWYQFFAGIGVSEIDDIISNTLGGVIGFYFGYLVRGKKLHPSKKR